MARQRQGCAAHFWPSAFPFDWAGMKVLHVIPSLSLKHGGPTSAMECFERALSRQGVSIETATTDDDGPGAHLVKPSGVPVTENDVIRRYFPKVMDFYTVSTNFAQWIARHVSDYDLVHIHALFSFTSTAAAFAARRAGVPYIIRPLGSLMRYGFARRRPLLKRFSIRLIEGRLLRYADAVHVTSSAELEQSKELGLSMRFVQIPLAVERASPGIESQFLERYPELRGKRIVLFIGRLDPVKNIEALLLAMSLCAKKVPEAVLVIGGAGPGAYQESLFALAARLGVADRVTWTGHMDQATKAAALRSAAIFALVSLSENFGIAAAEALAAGVPCVLSAGVAIARDVAQAGAGVEVRPEGSAIAAALVRLLTDEATRAEAARCALEFSEQSYSLERVGRRLSQLYADILSGAFRRNQSVTSD